MELDIWIAQIDRNQEINRHKFTDLPRLINNFPIQFDKASKRTVELIDVLWLNGQAIVSALEIESITSIFSGILKMADLIAINHDVV